MTDSRFCRKIIAEIQKNIIKTQESMDLDNWKKLSGIYIPYPEKSYSRIKKSLKDLNAMTETFQIELTNDKNREIYIKIK